MKLFNKKTPLEKELALLQKAEHEFIFDRYQSNAPIINRALDGKVPKKLNDTLETAFGKAFSVVFQKGSGLIEKTCGKKTRQQDYRFERIMLEGGMSKKQLRSFSAAAKDSGWGNQVMSGSAGIIMGVLGVGIPDIPLFTSFVLKSIYEIALSFGYSYDSEKEQIFILLLIQGAISSGEEIFVFEKRINAFIASGVWPEDMSLEEEEKKTATALAGAMLHMKFLQGIPIVGAVGGMYDAIYIKRIAAYAELKYRRRFLLGLK